MRVTVAGKQVDTGEALQTHVSDGLAAITGKYFDYALQAHVTFHRNRAAFACDIQLHAARGLTVRGEGEGPDAHRAFEVAAEHLAKRLRRYRRRVNEHARALASERMAEPELAPRGRAYVLRQEDEEEEEQQAVNGLDRGAVVAEHPARVDVLTVGEAVMRLDLSAAQVLMFREKASRRVQVVYRRADGHIGWIDPGEA